MRPCSLNEPPSLPPGWNWEAPSSARLTPRGRATAYWRDAFAGARRAVRESFTDRFEAPFQPLALCLCALLGSLAVGSAVAGILEDALERDHFPVESFEDVGRWGAMPDIRLCGNNVRFAFAAAWFNGDPCGFEGADPDLAMRLVETPDYSHFRDWWPSGCIEIGTSRLLPTFGVGDAPCNNIEVAAFFELDAGADTYWVTPVLDRSPLGSLPTSCVGCACQGVELSVSKVRQIAVGGAASETARARRNGFFTIVNASTHWNGSSLTKLRRAGYDGADPFRDRFHCVDVYMGFNDQIVHTVEQIGLARCIARRIAGMGGYLKICSLVMALIFVRKWAKTEAEMEHDRLTLRGYQRLAAAPSDEAPMVELAGR